MDHLRVLLYGEGPACRRLPDIPLIIIVLAHHSDLVRDKVGGVEAYTELASHGNVIACSHGLHEAQISV